MEGRARLGEIASTVRPSILVSILTGMSLWLWYPLLGKYLTWDLGFGGEELGIVFGAYNLSVALLSLPSGRLSDLIGKRATALIGALLLTSASALMTRAKALAPLSAAAFIAGAGFSFITTSLSAHAIERGGAKRAGSAYGLILSAALIGEVLGAFFGGFVKEFHGAVALFTLSALLALSAALPAALIAEAARNPSHTSSISVLSLLRSEREFKHLALGLILHTLGFSMILPFLSIHAREIGLSDYRIGVVNMTWTLSLAVASLCWGLIVDRVGGKRVLILHLILSVASWLFYGYSWNTLSIVSAAVVFGLVGSMDLPSRRKLLAIIDRGRGVAGTLVGALDLITGLSMIPGPLIAGILYSHMGSTAPFWAASLLNLAGLAMLAKLKD